MKYKYVVICWATIAIIGFIFGNYPIAILCCIIFYGENILNKLEK